MKWAALILVGAIAVGVAVYVGVRSAMQAEARAAAQKIAAAQAERKAESDRLLRAEHTRSCFKIIITWIRLAPDTGQLGDNLPELLVNCGAPPKDADLLTRDGWGNPIRLKMTTEARELWEQLTFGLTSAGPDGQFDTPDDIHSTHIKSN